MCINWYSNSTQSGEFEVFGTNPDCTNGTYTQQNSNFNEYNQTYWWYVSVSDGTDIINSDVYSFTTKSE